MEVNRRTQADRSAATRAALLAAATPLFAEHGFAGVGTETIVRAAGVTRGALYHQFADKAELFAAVFEEVEADLTRRLAAQVLEASADDPLAALQTGTEAWLDACEEPVIRRIVLIEAPAVLGWERWREVASRHGLALVEAVLRAAMDAARIREQPVRPLAHVLIGALDEAALYCAEAEDPVTAREEMSEVLGGILAALALPAA